jgi:hypothetical protein
VEVAVNPPDRSKTDALIALNRKVPVMYAGTVPADEIARRRAANKRAKAARKTTRRSK